MNQEKLLLFPNPRLSDNVVVQHDFSCEMITTSIIAGKLEDIFEHAAWLLQNDSSDGPGINFLAQLKSIELSPNKEMAIFTITKKHYKDNERYLNCRKDTSDFIY